MLLSISMILIVGMSMGWICKKCKVPSLIGMLATGVVLGPYVFNLLDSSILGISAELRKIALIIILTRAGLGLDMSELKKIGRPAVLMCFVPASFELIGIIILASNLMGLTILEAAIMGAVLAAVSPAVVVPRMVKLMDEGYGTKEGIPQLILAGASVDDVYVIVLFSTFVGMMQGEGVSVLKFINIPISIFLGILIGLLLGFVLAYFFKKVHIRDTSKVLIILSVSFLLVVFEDKLTTPITFSALISIMFIGIGLQRKREEVAKRLSVKYGKLWVAAEVFLFVLVGATVNIGYTPVFYNADAAPYSRVFETNILPQPYSVNYEPTINNDPYRAQMIYDASKPVAGSAGRDVRQTGNVTVSTSSGNRNELRSRGRKAFTSKRQKNKQSTGKTDTSNK